MIPENTLPEFKKNTIPRSLLWAFGISLLIRFFIAARMPMTGDEAYYAIWARNLDWGYYDHGGLIAWMTAPFLALGSTEWLMRMPAILMPTIAAYVIYRILVRDRPRAAEATALLLTWHPLFLFNTVITTDTALLAACSLSGFALAWIFRAPEQKRGYVALGLTLSLGLFAKYLIAPLVLAVGIIFLLSWKSRPMRRGLAIVISICTVALLGHLYWNATHCYGTILFNAVTRHPSGSPTLEKGLIFWAYFAYTFSPPVLWILWRDRRQFRLVTLAQDPLARAFLLLGGIPIFFLAATGTRYLTSLQWPLSVYPILFITLGWMAREETIRLGIRLMQVFAFLHLPVVWFISFAPIDLVSNHPAYKSLVIHKYADEVVDHLLKGVPEDTLVATNGYTLASLLEFAVRKHQPNRRVLVLGSRSIYGRQDDFLTDFRTLDQRDFVIFDRTDQATSLQPWFEYVTTTPFTVHGMTFFRMNGHRFRYRSYRDGVLIPAFERFYPIPDHWPVLACPLRDRLNESNPN